MATLYQRRLMLDLAEIANNPYPMISFHSYENDINKACLVLTPPGLRKIHMTVDFRSRYPLIAPKISIQTWFDHPNVFDDYICASILNTDEGYTPAYTLKGIAIQILSFFSSDNLEQDHGNRSVNLKAYRSELGANNQPKESFRCSKCGFPSVVITGGAPSTVAQNQNSTNSTLAVGLQEPKVSSAGSHQKIAIPAKSSTKATLTQMPPEILIRICEYLESEHLVQLMRASSTVGGAEGVVTKYDLIRTRELQCFALKEGFGRANLGVGVHVVLGKRFGTFESEFDLLSDQAFKTFGIRKSVHGLRFEHWLPLAISRRHYQQIKDQLHSVLTKLGTDARLTSTSPVQVLYAFMNDVVVKLSTQAEGNPANRSLYGLQTLPESTLKHASEKAIESYYHLFHLLLCNASEDKTIIPAVNRTLARFLDGHNDKDAVPNLGHLLIMVLISDFDMDSIFTMAIIREAVTRNVVWMLDAKGAAMPELSYMEADMISHYRLAKTFEAGRTSYRLLMFFNLFRNTVNRGTGANRKTVEQLRDEIFDAHGAPPRGAATRLAQDVKHLQDINDFPNFIQIMGLAPPMASTFTTFLRDCCQESVSKGYSIWAYTQAQALELRKTWNKEPGVSVRPVSEQKAEWRHSAGGRGVSFFPNNKAGFRRR